MTSPKTIPSAETTRPQLEQAARRHAEELQGVELVGDDERVFAAAVHRGRALREGVQAEE